MKRGFGPFGYLRQIAAFFFFAHAILSVETTAPIRFTEERARGLLAAPIFSELATPLSIQDATTSSTSSRGVKDPKQLPNPRVDKSVCGGGKYVCDPQKYLTKAGYANIDRSLAELEKNFQFPCGSGPKRGFQVGVLLRDTFAPFASVEELATTAFDQWGLGYRPCNNGVILVLAIKDRKSTIRTGKGSRPALTDALYVLSHRIASLFMHLPTRRPS